MSRLFERILVGVVGAGLVLAMVLLGAAQGAQAVNVSVDQHPVGMAVSVSFTRDESVATQPEVAPPAPLADEPPRPNSGMGALAGLGLGLLVLGTLFVLSTRRARDKDDDDDLTRPL